MIDREFATTYNNFYTIVDLQRAVDNFIECPSEDRLTMSRRIVNRLKELKQFVNVYNDNPISQYRSDYFIITKRDAMNKYVDYADLCKKDLLNFNKAVFEDIQLELDKLNSLTEIRAVGNRLNEWANELIKKFYPEKTSSYYILFSAMHILANFYIAGSSEDVCHEALDQIHYIQTTYTLDHYHVKRVLYPIKLLKKYSLYNNLDTSGISNRIESIFSFDLVQKEDPWKDFFHDTIDPVEEYMCMQKRAHELAFVNSSLYSRADEVNSHRINVDLLKEIKELAKPYNLRSVITSDVYRLRDNGFDNIEEYRILDSNSRITGYRKDGVDYLILKEKENVFYFINKLRNGGIKFHKVTLTPKTQVMTAEEMDRLVESTFINPNKKNRL